IIETVGTGATTTTLTVSPNPILFGQSVTLTATISPSAATGTVTFFDGMTQLGLPAMVNAGVATLAVTSLETGTDTLTAVYSGDANYSPSTSTATTETVNTAPSTTVLTTDINQVVFGNPVRLTANVPIAGATGTVSFYSDGTLVGTSNLNNGGVAKLTASSLAVGNDTLTAVYSGDSNYNTSTSNGVVVAVSQGLTSTTLIADPTVVTVGSPVTFTVTVASNITGLPTPTGTVTLTADATVLATGLTLVNGTVTFTTTSLTLGQDSITASYNGDSNYLTSASPVTSVGVSAVTATTTTTTLTSSSLSPNYGDAVTFTAVVAPALSNNLAPTGTVTFYDGTVPLGTPVTISGGVALFTTTSLPPGSASITAVYNGDNNFNASTSAPVTETVIGNNNSGVYVTTLDVSAVNAAFGAPVTLTASVYATEVGTPPPFGGTVTFFSGAQTIGAATLGANGNAVFSTPLPAGTDEITAAYNGGGPITASLPRMVAISSPAMPSLAKANLPPAIVAGTAFHTNLPISLTNLGVSALKGLFTIQVYLDSSTTLDANRDLLTTISRTFNLNGGKSRVFHTPETFSPTLPDGTYYVLVDVTDPNGLTNLVASKPVVVAAPFVALSASVSATNPPNIAVGGSASLFVTLTNTGNEAISGLLDLSLTPSSDGVTQIPGKILGTGSITTTIQPGKSKKYRVVLDTTALANGSYFPYITASLDGVSATAVGVTPFRIG
ncbi:MAG TPA: Ig-like domain-containing protein, partial [Tepidisphaeraceae bacterium]|nr:Ig-like domain-containing protein [Tepidisphaeraceae bacterium]